MGSALIGLALLSVRLIASEFRPGTTTPDHPVVLLVTLLLLAGFVWLALIPILARFRAPAIETRRLALIGILIGLSFRAMFLGSTPIYEDDWNRYLWDGAVITQGVNPYLYAPGDIQLGSNNETLIRLKALSSDNGDFVKRINNPQLTTIYPPMAQVVFALAAMIKPFDLDVLRGLYWLSELLALLLLVKALSLFGRSPLWVWLYALNPMVIFTVFNGLHMDILLVPFILGSLILVRSRPMMASLCLACAVAIKLWPLILGPVLFRAYRQRFLRFVGYGAVLGGVSLLLCLPLLLHLGENSGLSAYSGTWQRSSFLFPYLETLFSYVIKDSPLVSRIFIGTCVSLVVFWYAFKRDIDSQDLPLACLVVTLVLYLLSPTGFPWYIIWFAFFIPFVPSYGVALLCVMVSLYYSRFWFGEAGQYDIYLNMLVPLQFGLPILIIIYEAFRYNRRQKVTT